MTARRCCEGGCGSDADGRYARFCAACRWRRRLKTPKYCWTPDKDVYLRQHYSPMVRRCGERIGARWGFPGWVVRRRASELGLARPNWRMTSRAWTDTEIAFVEHHAGKRHPHWIATQLDRTVTAVVMRIKRLGLTRRADGYTQSEVAVGFGVSRDTVEKWMRLGWLRARGRGEHAAYAITDRAIVDFAREHRHAFDLGKADQLWLLDVLLGPPASSRSDAA